MAKLKPGRKERLWKHNPPPKGNLFHSKDLLGWMLKASLIRGVMGGGVSWELGGAGDTEKRLSLDITLSTWLLGLWGLRGLIWGDRTRETGKGREK